MFVSCGWLRLCESAGVCLYVFIFFFKQKTAYEMRISDWSSDVCSSDLLSGDSVYPVIDTGTPYVANLVTYNPFTKANEKSWQLRYEYDFAALGIPEIGRASCRERVCQYV